MNLGQEQTVTVNGKIVIVGRMTAGVLERFSEWVKPQLRDPFEGLEKLLAAIDISSQNGLALANGLVKTAEQKAEAMENLTWDSPLVQRFMKTVRGSAYLTWLLIKDKWPESTLNDAFDVAEAMSKEIGGLPGFFDEADTSKLTNGTTAPSSGDSCTANLTIAPGKSA